MILPKIVDHADRRRELAEAAWRLIARHGIDEVTTRQIAKESGYSNGVLTHYFENKDEILLAAFELSHVQIDKRYDNLTRGQDSFAALRAILHDNLPEDDQRSLETRVEMSFWVRALTNAKLRDVQDRESTKLQALIRSLIASSQESGRIHSQISSEDLTAVIAAVIDGLSLHSLLYPDRFPGDRLADLMAIVLDLVSTPSEVSPTTSVG